MSVASVHVRLGKMVHGHWTNTMHNLQGNIGMGDGSVQQLSTSRTRDALRNSDDASNQLQIPGDEKTYP